MVNLGLSIRGGERREEELRFARKLGYTAVEISLDGTGLVFGGRLPAPMLREALAAFGKHEFRYSIHSPSSLDLRDRANRENQMTLARAALQFCREVGGRVLVIHFEQQSQDPEDEAAFEEAVLRLSDEAGDVLLGIENIEVERLEPVIECVRRINRPNVAMTLDIGHAHLAAVYFRFDFLEGIRSALPHVRHVHVNDNFGRYDPLRLENFTLYRTQTPADTFPLGKGDLHLPVGWGTIPLETVFESLRGFRGTVVHEYRYNLFLASAEDDFARAHGLVAILDPSATRGDGGGGNPWVIALIRTNESFHPNDTFPAGWGGLWRGIYLSDCKEGKVRASGGRPAPGGCRRRGCFHALSGGRRVLPRKRLSAEGAPGPASTRIDPSTAKIRGTSTPPVFQ